MGVFLKREHPLECLHYITWKGTQTAGQGKNTLGNNMHSNYTKKIRAGLY
jgi:hypothetical protein